MNNSHKPEKGSQHQRRLSAADQYRQIAEDAGKEEERDKPQRRKSLLGPGRDSIVQGVEVLNKNISNNTMINMLQRQNINRNINNANANSKERLYMNCNMNNKGENLVDLDSCNIDIEVHNEALIDKIDGNNRRFLNTNMNNLFKKKKSYSTLKEAPLESSQKVNLTVLINV